MCVTTLRMQAGGLGCPVLSGLFLGRKTVFLKTDPGLWAPTYLGDWRMSPRWEKRASSRLSAVFIQSWKTGRVP